MMYVHFEKLSCQECRHLKMEPVVLVIKTEGFENPDIKKQRLQNNRYSDSYTFPEMKGKKKANLPDNQAS